MYNLKGKVIALHHAVSVFQQLRNGETSLDVLISIHEELIKDIDQYLNRECTCRKNETRQDDMLTGELKVLAYILFDLRALKENKIDLDPSLRAYEYLEQELEAKLKERMKGDFIEGWVDGAMEALNSVVYLEKG